MLDEEDEVPQHVCGEVPVEPEELSWWFFPAMVGTLFANLTRCGVAFFAAWVQFWEEVGHRLFAHGLWTLNQRRDETVVDSFRSQLTKL